MADILPQIHALKRAITNFETKDRALSITVDTVTSAKEAVNTAQTALNDISSSTTATESDKATAVNNLTAAIYNLYVFAQYADEGAYIVDDVTTRTTPLESTLLDGTTQTIGDIRNAAIGAASAVDQNSGIDARMTQATNAATAILDLEIIGAVTVVKAELDLIELLTTKLQDNIEKAALAVAEGYIGSMPRDVAVDLIALQTLITNAITNNNQDEEFILKIIDSSVKLVTDAVSANLSGTIDDLTAQLANATATIAALNNATTNELLIDFSKIMCCGGSLLKVYAKMPEVHINPVNVTSSLNTIMTIHEDIYVTKTKNITYTDTQDCTGQDGCPADSTAHMQ
jgi:hypothetical protein